MKNTLGAMATPTRLIKHGELVETPLIAQALVDWQQAVIDTEQVGVGVSLLGETDLFESGLLEHTAALELIAVEFPSFTDGRGFSLATQLRQFGFKGELRATGAILVDQLHYLQRCGFDAFELGLEQDLTVALEALGAFSQAYQPGW